MTSHLRHSPWIIWGVGAGVYFLGFIHRASLGVAGPLAVTHLNLTATQLGTFIMVQLGLYALMQVPAGMAIDRWGPRKVLLAATLAMGTAQVMFAFATSYPLALLARALLGVGDAAVFIAVLRLAAAYFGRRRYAVLTMLTGLTGMLGNLVATVPLVLALGAWGWKTTFLFSGAASLVYALLLLRPSVRGQVEPSVPQELSPQPLLGFAAVRSVWGRAEVRLGFWTHLATLMPALVLSLLWGFPYLTDGLGYTEAGAASMLSMYILVSLGASFVTGPIAGRRPGWRATMALSVALAATLSLATVSLWPGTPPLPVVAAVFAIAAVGGPTSQIGFHLARDYNPAETISTATGLVNAGGFIGAMIASVMIGVVLDGLSSSMSPLDAYQWAILTLAAISFGATLIMLLSLLGVRARVRMRMRAGEDVIVPVREHVWDRAYTAMTGRGR